MGVRVPDLRKIANTFENLGINALNALLTDKINEKRLLALLILINQYSASQTPEQKRLYRSTHLWERRFVIVSTLHFIRHHKLTWTFKIATQLLGDKHDLIHPWQGHRLYVA
jgi:3-methyladenine DNA glycosylase AlkD